MALFFVIFTILLIILLFIAIFSTNIKIAVYFYTSTKHKQLYEYSIKIKGFPKKKKKSPKKSKFKEDILNHLHLYKPHIDIASLSITGSVSLGRADLTAAACGMLFSVSGSFCGLLSTLCNSVQVEKIRITPIYDNDVNLELVFNCILKFNLGNIIFERLKCLKGANKNVKSN